MPDDEDLISVTDAVERTGIPRRTILHHISNGLLPAQRPSSGRGAWLIHQHDLDDYRVRRNGRRRKPRKAEGHAA